MKCFSKNKVSALVLISFLFTIFPLFWHYNGFSQNNLNLEGEGEGEGEEEGEGRNITNNRNFNVISSGFLINYNGVHPGGTYGGFDNNKAPVKALKANCSSSYERISSGMSAVPNEQSKKELVIQLFKTEMDKCGRTLFRDYYEDIYLKAILKSSHFGLMAEAFLDHGLQIENQTPYYDDEMKVVKNDYVNDYVNDISKPKRLLSSHSFFQDCVKKVYAISDHISERSKPKISPYFPSEWAGVFNALWDKECYQRRLGRENFYSMKDFVNRTIARLEGTQENCRVSSGCVEELKQKVGLLPIDSGKHFYSTCLENLQDTGHCCSESSLQNCSRYNEIQNKYQNVVSQGQEQCTQHINSTISENIGSICERRSNDCSSACTAEHEWFKKEFLQCFFLPSWKEEANYWAKGENSCKGPIAEIRKAYNNNRKNKEKNPPPLSLASVYTDVMGDCDKSWLVLKNRISDSKAEASPQLLEDLCKQKQAEETKEEDSQNAESDPYGNRNSYRDTASSSGSSRNPSSFHSSPGQMDFQSNGGFSRSPNSQGYNNSNLRAEERTKTDKKMEELFKDSEKFDKSEYEKRFDPLSVRGGGDSSNSSFGKGKAEGEGLSDTEGGSSSKTTRYTRSREIASIKGINLSDASIFESFNFPLSSQGSYLASLGRKVRKSLSSALKPFKVPTVQSVFKVHGSEVNLLARQRQLFDQFCKSHSCNFG